MAEPDGHEATLGEELAGLALGITREAGELLLDYATTKLAVGTKTSGTDPVSEADEESERLITERIATERPDDAILGEEDARNRDGTSGIRWVVDPLDGTVNYLYGIPAWCVSICCEDTHGALAGVVHDPMRGETFVAVRGRGTQVNGREARVGTVGDLSEALVATGFAYSSEQRAVQGRWIADLLPRARDIRRVGAAALDLAWTACGRIDGFYEWGIKHWDYAAGLLLVAEAGGTTSRWAVDVAGQSGDCVVAGAHPVHDALLDWLGARTTLHRPSG